jgi:hypothetical protein
MRFTVRESIVMLESLVEDQIGKGLFEAKQSKLTPYQKAQQNRRQTIALHTPRPSKQSVFYKHAVRAIFQKLRKDGEAFRQAAKGGQLIAQWMLKKHKYATGSAADPWAEGGGFSLTAKGNKRNRDKHLKEPKSVLKKKAKAYDWIMGIQRRQAAQKQAVKSKSLGAG